MNSVVKGLMQAGIGGVITYAVVGSIITNAITGTTSSDTFLQTIVPLVIAAGVVWLIVAMSFKD